LNLKQEHSSWKKLNCDNLKIIMIVMSLLYMLNVLIKHIRVSTLCEKLETKLYNNKLTNCSKPDLPSKPFQNNQRRKQSR